MSTASTCYTGAATSRYLRPEKKHSTGKRRSSTVRSAKSPGGANRSAVIPAVDYESVEPAASHADFGADVTSDAGTTPAAAREIGRTLDALIVPQIYEGR